MALEQLWWLVRMAGALLADAGEGETPLPPLPLAAAACAAPPGADPLAGLSRELLALLALALDPAARPALSPRSALACTSKKLMPEPHGMAQHSMDTNMPQGCNRSPPQFPAILWRFSQIFYMIRCACSQAMVA